MSMIETLPLEPDFPAETPDAYVEAMVKRAGTSFYWAMRSLNAERRRGVFAIYGFCRDVDDIADGDLPLERKRILLDMWRLEIGHLFDGKPTHPISRALIEPVKNFSLKQEDFIAVIDGMEMDAFPRVRLRDMAELELYCDRVACAVGRLCVRVFGLEEEQGIELSAALGAALQLTNILRDIHEDAERDRVYLPADMLRAANAAGDEIADVITAPGLSDLCADIASRAQQHFENASKIIARCNKDAVRPAHMMMQVYYRIFQKLQNRGWHELDRDVSPSKAEKLFLAFRYGLFG